MSAIADYLDNNILMFSGTKLHEYIGALQSDRGHAAWMVSERNRQLDDGCHVNGSIDENDLFDMIGLNQQDWKYWDGWTVNNGYKVQITIMRSEHFNGSELVIRHYEHDGFGKTEHRHESEIYLSAVE